MPAMDDPFFRQSVIYLFEHAPDGSMGIIVNKTLQDLEIEIMGKIYDFETKSDHILPTLYFGGPVAMQRGIVVHDSNYYIEGTYRVSDTIALTTNEKIMEEFHRGQGPDIFRFTLGYSSWGTGQLEHEIQRGDWLIFPADFEMVFHLSDDKKWETAIVQLGLDPTRFSTDRGMA